MGAKQEVKKLITLTDGRQVVVETKKVNDNKWSWCYHEPTRSIEWSKGANLIKVIAVSFPLEGIPQFDPIDVRMRLRKDTKI